MAQTCKVACERQKSVSFTNNLRYKIGQKWCSWCALFLLTEENTCPCCKTGFRTKAKSKSMKCQECNHEKEKCECLCCCSISQIGCMYCILPVLGYRQILKNIEKKSQIEFQR
jgi:hypothetical protein